MGRKGACRGYVGACGNTAQDGASHGKERTQFTSNLTGGSREDVNTFPI